MDEMDKVLTAMLSQDGRHTTQELSTALGVTAPTTRGRVRSLLERGLLRLAGLVNPDLVEGITVCLIGITFEKYLLGEKLKEIANLEKVNWAAIVAGRYDVVAEVVSLDGNAGISDFLLNDLGRIEGIKSSETFVVMKSRNKWLLLPDALAARWRRGGRN